MEELQLVKVAFDTMRSALGLMKDAKDVLPEGPRREAIEQSLDASENQLQIAEAEIAQSLGYPLCRCAFPPTPMLKIGYRTHGGPEEGVTDVHECPKCKQNDAGPWMFEDSRKS